MALSRKPKQYPQWEEIEMRSDGGDTFRLRVPGGWLYRVREGGPEGEDPSIALVFVAHRKDRV